MLALLASGPAFAQGTPEGAPAPADTSSNPLGTKVPGVVGKASLSKANGQVEREETVTVSIPPEKPTVVYRFTTRNGTLSSATLQDPRYTRHETAADSRVPPEKTGTGPIDLVSTWSTAYLPFRTRFEELTYPGVVTLAIRKGASDGVVENGLLLPPTNRDALLVDKPLAEGDQLVVTSPAAIAGNYTVKTVGAGGSIGPNPAFAAGKHVGVAYEVKRQGDLAALYQSDPTYVRVSPEAGLPLVYVWPDPRYDLSPVFVERRFDTGKVPYELTLSMTVTNLDVQALRVRPAIALSAWQHPASMGSSMFGAPTPQMEGSCKTTDGMEHSPFKALHGEAIDNFEKGLGATHKIDHSVPTIWAGVGTNYFLSAVTPMTQSASGQCSIDVVDFDVANPGNWVLSTAWSASSVQPVQGRQANGGGCAPSWVAQKPAGAPSCGDALTTLGLTEGAGVREIENAFAQKKKGGDLAALTAAHDSLTGRKQATWRFSLYNGPKESAMLAAVNPELESSVTFGWMSFVGRPLHKVLVWFHDGLGSWPIAIILLTFILKLITWPLNTRNYRQMLKMQGLKPKLDELKKKIGDDKQRFAQEQMALYKREGVNPLAGCLPMLLQLPIWVGLYGAILGSVELYHEPLALWVQDLSAPDPYFVMPILMGTLTFIQTWLTPNAGGTDATQAKIMKYGMPLLFTVFMLFLPSGLVLYTTVNAALTIGQNMLIRRKYAAPTNTAKVPA